MESLLHLVSWQAVVILKLCVGFQRIHLQNLHRRITRMYIYAFKIHLVCM